MFHQDIGIDLGTANILFYKKGKGIILREPSVVAVEVSSGRVLRVGREAKEMLGRTPGSVIAVRPLRDGVIADYDRTAALLAALLRRAGGGRLSRMRVMIGVPTGVTPVENRAVEKTAQSAGVKNVYIIEEPLAAAIGAGLPVSEPVGSMVVDIGGGTTEVAVISLNGIVESHSVRMAGDKMDEIIASYVKRRYNVLVGERTAEEIKITIGSVYPTEGEESITVRGRDITTGLPASVTLQPEEVREAMLEPAQYIVEAIKLTLERTPPELAADICSRGVMLTGGGALIRGIDRLISAETGLHVSIAENPLDCVAIGAGLALERLEKFKDSLLDVD